MTKVYIAPQVKDAPYGIQRVIEAMDKYLPGFGVTPVKTAEEADVVNVHATAFVDTDKPVLYSSHGLYWEDDGWPAPWKQANQAMINFMLQANVGAITAVSNWVNYALRRGMLREPETIYHGVDVDTWRPRKDFAHQGYVLWNKARIDPVSNPAEMERLATMLPEIGFVSTVGQAARNIQITGTVEHETMRDMVRNAGVYLSTARETFGIGTLEALACGVPVVGWAIGGNLEIIENGRNGFLVPYGNYDALRDATREAMGNREMRAYARETAVSKWTWPERIRQYANLMQILAERGQHKGTQTAVSIIVTAHNMEKYLTMCLNSIMAQPFTDWECVIVDDVSTDDTPEIAKHFEELDGRFRLITTPHNLLTAGARNYGMSYAHGRYLLPLDGDDMLGEDALSHLVHALDTNRSIHIAYGSLDTVNEEGENRQRNPWPTGQFNWFDQVAHVNQLPYMCLMRREVWETSGGYKTRDRWTEDANFWTYVTSMGYRASRVTDETTLIYRLRESSKSHGVEAKNEGWTSWYPWNIATNNKDGYAARKTGKTPPRYIVPWSSQSTDAQHQSWPVWRHDEPMVSVVIPVGPGHEKYVIDAVDSVQAQTFPWWECIVVDNTLDSVLSDVVLPPWVKRVTNHTPSIAISRNKGVEAASAPLICFLDADDMITPNALADLVDGYVQSDGRYTYGDWMAVTTDGLKKESSKDYSQMAWGKTGLHPITCLIPKEWIEAVGGFDPHVPGWEDWEFFIKLAVNGYCGFRIGSFTMAYRVQAGQRREQSLADAGETLPLLKERYSDYFEGRRTMAGCCGGNGSTIIEAKRRMGLMQRPSERSVSQMSGIVRIEYTGVQTGTRTFTRVAGVELSAPVRLGNNTIYRYADVPAADAKMLVDAGFAKYINQPDTAVIQATTAKPDLPRAPIPEPAPIPKPEPEAVSETAEAVAADDVPDLKEISEMNVTNFKKAAAELSLADLKSLLQLETEEGNRKSVISFLETLIADAERVS